MLLQRLFLCALVAVGGQGSVPDAELGTAEDWAAAKAEALRTVQMQMLADASREARAAAEAVALEAATAAAASAAAVTAALEHILFVEVRVLAGLVAAQSQTDRASLALRTSVAACIAVPTSSVTLQASSSSTGEAVAAFNITISGSNPTAAANAHTLAVALKLTGCSCFAEELQTRLAGTACADGPVSATVVGTPHTLARTATPGGLHTQEQEALARFFRAKGRIVPLGEQSSDGIGECALDCVREHSCIGFSYDNVRGRCRWFSARNRAQSMLAFQSSRTALYGTVEHGADTATVQPGALPGPDAARASKLCDWSPWSGWSPCSRSCGLGQRSRTRISLQSPESIAVGYLDGPRAGHVRHAPRCTATAEREMCNSAACPNDATAWTSDVWLEKSRTSWPGDGELAWNSDFSLSSAKGEPLGWEKDSGLRWSYTHMVHGAAHGAVTIVAGSAQSRSIVQQQWISLTRGKRYALRVSGQTRQVVRLLARASVGDKASLLVMREVPRLSPQLRTVEAVFVAEVGGHTMADETEEVRGHAPETFPVDIGIAFEGAVSNDACSLTRVSLREVEHATEARKAESAHGWVTPAPKPAGWRPSQLVGNARFTNGLASWESHDGGKLSAVKFSSRNGELTLRPPTLHSGPHPGMFQRISQLTPGAHYRLTISGRLVRARDVATASARGSKDGQLGLARLWVSTAGGEDVVWGARNDDRLGSSSSVPKIIHSASALTTGDQSAEVSGSFVVPAGVTSARIGVLFCCGFERADVVYVDRVALYELQPCSSFRCSFERHHCHFGGFRTWRAAKHFVGAVGSVGSRRFTGGTCDGVHDHASLRVYHQGGEGSETVCKRQHRCHATVQKKQFCEGSALSCNQCVCEGM